MARKPREIAKILVIKLGALGELVLAFPAIRAHPPGPPEGEDHPPDHRRRSRRWPSRARYFNDVEADGAPKDLGDWTSLILRIRRAHYDRVYDLQNLVALQPDLPGAAARSRRHWSGAAIGASLPHRNPRPQRHAPLERQADQLKDAGIWPDAPTKPGRRRRPTSAGFCPQAPSRARSRRAGAHRPMVLLVPGASAHQPDKRWPVERYGELAEALQDARLRHRDRRRAAAKARWPRRSSARRQARDLTGRTDFVQIAALGARAALAVGNDTGPLHLIAAAGAPTHRAVLHRRRTRPLAAPRGHVDGAAAPNPERRCRWTSAAPSRLCRRSVLR